MKKLFAALAFLSLGTVLPATNTVLMAPALAQDGAVQQAINKLKRSQATGGAETAFMSAGSATMYGIEWVENKKYLEASWRFQEAIKTDPEYSIAHFLLGRAYAGMGKKELAQEAFAEAARLNPEFAAEAEAELAKLAPPQPRQEQPPANQPREEQPAANQPEPANPPQQAAPALTPALPVGGIVKVPAKTNQPQNARGQNAQPQKTPKLPPLKHQAGHAIGRCVDMKGKPLAGVRIRVFGVAKNGNDLNFTTRTNAAGAYSVKLPAGIFHVGWALWDVPAPNGPAYSLPLHPIDGSINEAPSAAGVVEDFVLKISGRILPRNDAQSDLSYYGGSVRVFGGAIANPPQFGDSSYRFPEGSSVEITLVPQGALIDRSAGKTLTLRKAMVSSASFLDVPIGRYSVTAKLIEADGTQKPLRVAVARLGVGTSPIRFTPTPAEFAESGVLYFPSSGDSTPLLTMPGVSQADVYVQP